jgi:hypothetical protein
MSGIFTPHWVGGNKPEPGGTAGRATSPCGQRHGPERHSCSPYRRIAPQGSAAGHIDRCALLPGAMPLGQLRHARCYPVPSCILSSCIHCRQDSLHWINFRYYHPHGFGLYYHEKPRALFYCCLLSKDNSLFIIIQKAYKDSK